MFLLYCAILYFSLIADSLSGSIIHKGSSIGWQLLKFTCLTAYVNLKRDIEKSWLSTRVPQ